MADLAPFADRMEDTEIGANKPLTETLFTKYGQNINFLLDFLGVSDGSTAPSGALNDLVNAINIIDGHVITKQGTFAGGYNLVGNYSSIKYVNRVFWARNEAIGGNPAGSIPRAFTKSINGGPNVRFGANPTTPANTSPSIGEDDSSIDLATGPRRTVFGDDNDTSSQTAASAYLQFFDPALGNIGYQSPMRTNEWCKLGVLRWTEYNTCAVREYHEPVAANAHIYMSLEFDLKSAGFYA